MSASLPPLPGVRVRIHHEVGRHVADHLDLDLALGEIPTAVVTAEPVVVAADDDRLYRHRLGVLQDAESGPGGGGSVAVELDDGIEHQMPCARGVAMVGVSTGGHRE